MASSSKSNTRYHIRSISLPCRSHPSTLRIEDELKKLETWEGSSTSMAKNICNGLSGLEELYKCVDVLYNSPLTQKTLSRPQNEKCVDELLDRSLRFLDICGITKDYMSQIKENVRDLQSALRRRKGDSRTENSFVKYSCFRKKMKRDTRKLISTMSKMDSKIIESSPVVNLDHHNSLIRVLKEVNEITISIFQTLLMFLSVKVPKAKPTRWSLVSKLLHKGVVTCEDQLENMNELERVDFELERLCRYDSSEGDEMKIAQESLEALEGRIEVFENGLECLFRGLIKVRASLLNIVSH